MKIISGIISTTNIDRHNERMSKNALEGMSKQIKEKFIPQLIEHDWNRHIGVLLFSEVFQLQDGEYALGVVSGIFENEKEKSHYVTGEPNNVWRDYQNILNIDELKILSDNHSKGGNKFVGKLDNSIADLLETHLNSTKVLPNGTVYKIKRYISSTGDLRIEVYPKDHEHQSHFHVISKQRGMNARFDISTLEVISTKAGRINISDVKKIQNFFEVHPQILMKLKEELNRLNRFF